MSFPSAVKLETISGTFLCKEDDHISRQLIEYGAHTRNELSMVLDHLNPGDIVLDIGAHIGTFAIPMAKKVQHGKVFAFEADIDSYYLLVQNIKLNALEEVIVPIHTLVTSGQKSSFTKNVLSEDNTGGTYYLPTPDHNLAVSTTTLSRWIESNQLTTIDFIKMDVEGMEFILLNNIKELLHLYSPNLYIEIAEEQLARYNNNAIEIENLLRTKGYVFYKNFYKRNSSEDKYIKKEIDHLTLFSHFDVLALK